MKLKAIGSHGKFLKKNIATWPTYFSARQHIILSVSGKALYKCQKNITHIYLYIDREIDK